MLFHPVDTITKRLMSNKQKYVVPGQTAQNLSESSSARSQSQLSSPRQRLNRRPHVSLSLVRCVLSNLIIFKHSANAGVMTKAVSLFPGLGFAAGYKILQRTYKVSGAAPREQRLALGREADCVTSGG